MKFKFSIILSSLTLAMSVGAGLSISNRNKNAEPVEATYSQTVNQYYSGINWDHTGSTLKNDLYKLIGITKAGWSYDGLFTCYQTSDTRADGTVWDIYSDSTRYTHSSPHSGSAEGSYFNREHMIPQSTFNKAAPMVSDPHHVLPSDGKVNNMRSNYPHGNVVSNITYTSNDGCKLGNDSNGTKVFEPLPQYKGDIARIYLYFVTCYESKMSSNSFSAFQSSFPHIKSQYLSTYLKWAKDDPVSQKEIDRNNAIYAGQGNRNPFIDCPYAVGAIWDSDHASDYGTKGQYTSGAGIVISKTSASLITGGTTTISATSSDASTISWTTSNSSVVSLSSSSSSSGNNITLTAGSSGTATITAKATIGGTQYPKTCTVTVSSTKQVSSISVTGQKTSYNVDDTFVKPTVTATYNDSTYSTVTDSASFSGYDLSTAGEQTVTVSYSYGGATATTTYDIDVSLPGQSGSQKIVSNSGSSYYESGDIYFTGGSDSASTSCDAFDVSWLKNNGSNAIALTYAEIRVYTSHSFMITPKTGYTITSVVIAANSSSYASAVGGTSVTNCTKNVSGSTVTLTPTDGEETVGFTNAAQSRLNSVTVNYEYGSGGSSSVSPTLTSIELDTSNVKVTYNVGESFNSSGLVVTANYSDESFGIVAPTSISSPNMSTAGVKTVTVSYTEGEVTETADFSITVNSVATLSSISLDTSNATTTFYVGDTFSYSGLVVTATYSDSSSHTVTPTSVSSPDMTSAGNKTVTVSYTEGGVTKTKTYSITVNTVTLSSISLSGQTTSFIVGDTFSFGGTVTAHYNNGSTADVTSSATFSGYNMSTSGNQTVTVSYGGESQTYQITVNEQSSATDSTQYSLITSTSDLEAGKSYIITNGTSGTVKSVAVTTSGNNRKSSSVSISNNKITRGSSVMSFTLGGSSGAWTFATENYAGTNGYLASDGDNNYLKVVQSAGTATIAFSNSAATINIGPSTTRKLICYNAGIDSSNGGFSCYKSQGDYGLVYLWKEVSTKTLSSITLDTSNVQTTFSVGDTFNYTGLVVTAHYSDSSSKTVTPTSVSTPSTSTTGNKTVTVSYTESGTTKTANYSITVNSNPSISWTAPTIKEYSGSTLSGTDVNGWAVTYNDGAGHQTVLTYSQLTVKLGGTTISIPYTWNEDDEGKTLTATYNSLTTSESSAVEIIQTVNSINAPSTSAWDFTFEAQKWTAAGSQTLSGKTWTMSGTDDGNPFFGYDSTKGQQFGSGSHPFSDVSLQSSAFSGTIDSVTVYTSGASSINATVQVSVGGTAYGTAKTITTTNTAYTFDLGGKSGTISIDYVNSSSKAIYVKEIVVNTVSGSANIANSEDHMDAQKVAVKFAKAFNAAMTTTSYCTTNMSSAWSTCSSAYNTFKSEAAALGSTEEAYAKNLIKYATAQYSDDSGEACIERMLKTYEVCVQKHGQTAFMSDLVTVGSNNVSPLVNIVGDNKSAIIIVIVSLLSASTIAGYFFIQRRKPE